MEVARKLSYGEAIREALDQAMEHDDTVVVFGLDVDDPKRILGTTQNLLEKYGAERLFGTPLSEEAMTGVAIGMAIAGLRPVHVHIRMDFLLLCMNQLVNMAAKLNSMTGGQLVVPLVVRGIVGKSWGQGAQHSQSLYSLFAHIPGLKVITPTTPFDAKGGMRSAIMDNGPVIFVEQRLLHYQTGYVPVDHYEIEPGKGRIVVAGEDITVVGISYMLIECQRAEKYLHEKNISVELIDPIWLVPIDIDLIVSSVKKTGKLCVVDNDWLSCGLSAEIITSTLERLQGEREITVHRIGFSPVTCAPSPPLENAFYPNAQGIASKINKIINGEVSNWVPDEQLELSEIEFKGPF